MAQKEVVLDGCYCKNEGSFYSKYLTCTAVCLRWHKGLSFLQVECSYGTEKGTRSGAASLLQNKTNILSILCLFLVILTASARTDSNVHLACFLLLRAPLLSVSVTNISSFSKRAPHLIMLIAQYFVISCHCQFTAYILYLFKV